MGTRLINWRQVAHKIGRSRSWIFSHAREGTFPKPLHLPDLPGKALWEESTIDQWISDMIALGGRDDSAPRKPGAVDVGMAENAVRHKWISCTDHLPEKEGDLYLVFLPDKRYGLPLHYWAMVVSYYRASGWTTDERVTHWMHLPEPPK